MNQELTKEDVEFLKDMFKESDIHNMTNEELDVYILDLYLREVK